MVQHLNDHAALCAVLPKHYPCDVKTAVVAQPPPPPVLPDGNVNWFEYFWSSFWNTTEAHILLMMMALVIVLLIVLIVVTFRRRAITQVADSATVNPGESRFIMNWVDVLKTLTGQLSVGLTVFVGAYNQFDIMKQFIPPGAFELIVGLFGVAIYVCRNIKQAPKPDVPEGPLEASLRAKNTPPVMMPPRMPSPPQPMNYPHVPPVQPPR